MSIFKKVIGEIEITKDLLLLLFIGGLYFLSIALSNTFVNVYLWKQSQSFVDIGLYNLMIVIFQPLTFILAGRWAKKIDRVIVLRIGVISLSLFYLTVLIFGSDAFEYLLLLGAILGIGFGFYWLAYNVLTFEITEPETRDFFNGFSGLLSSFGGMIGPIFAGWVITSMANNTGYTIIFTISLSLFTLAVVLSFFLKRRPAEGTYSFKRIIMERNHNHNWRDILHAHFFQGLKEGTFIFVIVVWVFITTNNELALGTFGLIQSGVMFISYYFATRLIKPSFRKKSILLGGSLLYGAISLIIFKVNFTLLIIYGAIVALAYPILYVPYMSLTYDVIGKGWQAAEMRIEYIVVRELFYNAGRIVSILFFIGTVFFFKVDSIRYLLIFLGGGHFAIYFFIRHINLKQKRPNHSIQNQTTNQLRDGESGSPV